LPQPTNVDVLAFRESTGLHPPPDSDGEQRAAYLEYLRTCLRQAREPAPEVVEMGRGLVGGDGASLLSLQIRTAEEQLGLARPPAGSIAGGGNASATLAMMGPASRAVAA
jgi:hypothetical protein